MVRYVTTYQTVTATGAPTHSQATNTGGSSNGNVGGQQHSQHSQHHQHQHTQQHQQHSHHFLSNNNVTLQKHHQHQHHYHHQHFTQIPINITLAKSLAALHVNQPHQQKKLLTAHQTIQQQQQSTHQQLAIASVQQQHSTIGGGGTASASDYHLQTVAAAASTTHHFRFIHSRSTDGYVATASSTTAGYTTTSQQHQQHSGRTIQQSRSTTSQQQQQLQQPPGHQGTLRSGMQSTTQSSTPNTQEINKMQQQQQQQQQQQAVQQQQQQQSQAQMVSFQSYVPTGSSPGVNVRVSQHQQQSSAAALYRNTAAANSRPPRHNMIYHPQQQMPQVVLPYAYTSGRQAAGTTTLFTQPIHFQTQMAPGNFPSYVYFPVAGGQRPGQNGPTMIAAGPGQPQQIGTLTSGAATGQVAQLTALQSTAGGGGGVTTLISGHGGQTLQAVQAGQQTIGAPPPGVIPTVNGNGGQTVVSVQGVPNSALMAAAINAAMVPPQTSGNIPAHVLAAQIKMGRRIRKHAIDIVNPETHEVVVKGYDNASSTTKSSAVTTTTTLTTTTTTIATTSLNGGGGSGAESNGGIAGHHVAQQQQLQQQANDVNNKENIPAGICEIPLHLRTNQQQQQLQQPQQLPLQHQQQHVANIVVQPPNFIPSNLQQQHQQPAKHIPIQQQVQQQLLQQQQQQSIAASIAQKQQQQQQHMIDMSMQPTPIVSAICDGPSVDIPPKPAGSASSSTTFKNKKTKTNDLNNTNSSLNQTIATTASTTTTATVTATSSNVSNTQHHQHHHHPPPQHSQQINYAAAAAAGAAAAGAGGNAGFLHHQQQHSGKSLAAIVSGGVAGQNVSQHHQHSQQHQSKQQTTVSTVQQPHQPTASTSSNTASVKSEHSLPQLKTTTVTTTTTNDAFSIARTQPTTLTQTNATSKPLNTSNSNRNVNASVQSTSLPLVTDNQNQANKKILTSHNAGNSGNVNNQQNSKQQQNSNISNKQKDSSTGSVTTSAKFSSVVSSSGAGKQHQHQHQQHHQQQQQQQQSTSSVVVSSSTTTSAGQHVTGKQARENLPTTNTSGKLSSITPTSSTANSTGSNINHQQQQQSVNRNSKTTATVVTVPQLKPQQQQQTVATSPAIHKNQSKLNQQSQDIQQQQKFLSDKTAAISISKDLKQLSNINNSGNNKMVSATVIPSTTSSTSAIQATQSATVTASTKVDSTNLEALNGNIIKSTAPAAAISSQQIDVNEQQQQKPKTSKLLSDKNENVIVQKDNQQEKNDESTRLNNNNENSPTSGLDADNTLQIQTSIPQTESNFNNNNDSNSNNNNNNNNNHVEIVEELSKNVAIPDENTIVNIAEPQMENLVAVNEEEAIASLASTAATVQKVTAPSIQYTEGQWSPETPEGRKFYNKKQLLALKDSPLAKDAPDVNGSAIAYLLSQAQQQQAPQTSLLPPFMRNSGNKRGQSLSGVTNAGGPISGPSTSVSGMTKSGSRSGGGGGGGGSGKSGLIHVSLSLREDVKLSESENAWRPANLLRNEDLTPEKRNKEELLRKVRGILNKLTPEKFQSLVEQIMKLQIDTPDKVHGVMILVFEKAIDEPNFSASYAKLCETLAQNKVQSLDKTKDGRDSKIIFKSALIDKMQHEFDDNVQQRKAKEAKLRPIIEKIQECANNPERRSELEALLDDEERRIRRRSGGTVRFIGELFKIGMLTHRIIKSCIQQLLDATSEDKLECLCKLLTTVGKKYERNQVTYNLDETIQQMQFMADRKTEPQQKISSRIRFMLQDVIDLRRNNWAQKKHELAPKTMDQIQKDVEIEQMRALFTTNTYTSSGSNKSGGGGGDNDRGAGNRGGGRFTGGNSGNASGQGGGGRNTGSGSNDGGYYTKGSTGRNNQQQGDDTWSTVTSSKSNRSVDASKLGQMMSSNLNQDDIGETVLGKRSQFQWGMSTNQQSSDTNTSSFGGAMSSGNSFAALSNLDTNRGSNIGGSSGGGPRNRGSYHKGSMEGDRYNNDSRNTSQQNSRENSSSRQQTSQQRGGGDRSSGNSPWPYASGGNNSQNRQKQIATPGGLDRVNNATTSGSNLMLTRNGSSGNQVVQRHMSPAAHDSATTIIDVRSPRGSMSLTSNAAQSTLSQSSSEITGNLSAAQLVLANSSSKSNDGIASSSRHNSIERQSTPTITEPAEFAEPTDEEYCKIGKAVKKMCSSTVDSTLEDCIAIYCEFPRKYHWAFITKCLEEYLSLRDTKSTDRRHAAEIFINLYEKNLLLISDIRYGYEKFTELAEDLAVDVPQLWPYVFEFMGIFIYKKILKPDEVWNGILAEQLTDANKRKFIKSMLLYLIRDFGPKFTRKIWIESKFQWTQFIQKTDDIQKFIKENQFEFIEKPEERPPLLESADVVTVASSDASGVIDMNRISSRVKELLSHDADVDTIIDYINGNTHETLENSFIRSLAATILEHAIENGNKTYKLDKTKLLPIGVPLLQRFVDSKIEREIECLYAVQELINRLEHPPGLICDIFCELYENDVIQQDTFNKWRDSKEEMAGKGVAVKSLNSFFENMSLAETSDENN